MERSIMIFACAVVLNNYAALASFVLPGGLDFKDDAKEINARLEIVSKGKQLEFGEIDCAGYELLLSRVSQMRHLQGLNLIFQKVPYDGFVVECERLAGLTNLTSLSISSYASNSVRVSSISVCKRMPLKELGLMYVYVDGAAVVGEFTRLEDLSCTTEELVRCAPSGLKALWVEKAKFKGEVDLSRFRKMESLCLCNVKCKSIRGLGSLTELEWLQLVGMPMKNLSDMKSCSRLRSLEICNCREFDEKFEVADFKCFPLECLALENVPVKCIRGLENCPLKDLRIDGVAIESMDDICRLPNLERLDLTTTKIRLVDKEQVKDRFPKLESLTYMDQEGDVQCIEWE